MCLFHTTKYFSVQGNCLLASRVQVKLSYLSCIPSPFLLCSVMGLSRLWLHSHGKIKIDGKNWNDEIKAGTHATAPFSLTMPSFWHTFSTKLFNSRCAHWVSSKVEPLFHAATCKGLPKLKLWWQGHSCAPTTPTCYWIKSVFFCPMTLVNHSPTLCLNLVSTSCWSCPVFGQELNPWRLWPLMHAY